MHFFQTGFYVLLSLNCRDGRVIDDICDRASAAEVIYRLVQAAGRR